MRTIDLIAACHVVVAGVGCDVEQVSMRSDAMGSLVPDGSTFGQDVDSGAEDVGAGDVSIVDGGIPDGAADAGGIERCLSAFTPRYVELTTLSEPLLVGDVAVSLGPQTGMAVTRTAVFLFDAGTGTVEERPRPPWLGSMRTASLLDDGRAFIVGSPGAPSAVYSTRGFEQIEAAPGLVLGFAARIDDTLLFSTAEDSGTSLLRFSLEEMRWSKSSTSTATKVLAVALEDGPGAALFVGGGTMASPSSGVSRYLVEQDRWEQVAELSHPFTGVGVRKDVDELLVVGTSPEGNFGRVVQLSSGRVRNEDFPGTSVSHVWEICPGGFIALAASGLFSWEVSSGWRLWLALPRRELPRAFLARSAEGLRVVRVGGNAFDAGRPRAAGGIHAVVFEE